MRHIAFLIPTLDRVAGAERQVLLMARGLAARGWRVSVVSLSGAGGEQASWLLSHGVKFLSLHMRKGLVDARGWIALNRWLRQEQPDVLHAHLPHAAWIARWSRVFAPVPVVVDTVHTSGTGTRGRKLGYRISNWLADKVTAVSRGAADAWLNERMLPKRKLVVLPNGVDTAQWKPDSTMRVAMRERLGLCGEEFLWLAAGRLEAVKDFSTLLRAFAGLPSRARLVIAGEGSQHAELESLAASLGIANRLDLRGYVADILSWMQAADGFVLSSLWEGLPMSLLEASACELPAVATDVAGVAEILSRVRGELLARVGDFSSLQAAMLRLMQMPDMARRNIGTQARLQVEEHFSLAAVLDRWETLYEEFLPAAHETMGASACVHDADVSAR